MVNMDKKDYWDIDFLMPPKKTTANFSRDTDAVEIEVSPVEKPLSDAAKIPKRGEKKPITASNYKAEPITRYQPANRLIKSVAVWRWPSKYTFYERFRTDAIKLFTSTGEKCEYEPFFSYMPQYLQLNPNQRAYYLWWRDNARRNIWLKADYSYVYLYIYEIINLPDFISPAKGLDGLCDVWLAYREELPKLDRYMTEWVTDYCLINLLEPPLEKLRPIMGTLFENSTFREFFTPTGGDFYREALFTLACSYNWRQSKFYTDETAPLFERHIPAAFAIACDRLEKSDKRFSFNDGSFTAASLTRDAYTGSLCAYNVKRRIDVEYYAVSRSPELKMLVTDIIKYSENIIRGMKGIKSRFPTPTLSDEIKEAINEYFEPFKPRKAPKKEEAPDYMRQYDAPTTGITPEDALKIEARSWNTTEKLIEAFDEDDEKPERTSVVSPAISAEQPDENDAIGTIEGDSPPDSAPRPNDSAFQQNAEHIPPLVISLLTALRDGDNAAFISVAAENNLLPESAAELVNERLYDIIGDIVIEADGGAFSLIDDYKPDIDEIIKA